MNKNSFVIKNESNNNVPHNIIWKRVIFKNSNLQYGFMIIDVEL